MLKFYNSLTKTKETFKPLVEGQIKLYVCGITVYDYCHIGHARSMSVFDTIVRFLKMINYQVTYVRNITDIDDKIIARAQENQEEWSDLTTRFIQAMNEDWAKLNILTPDHQPKATEFIPQMITLISALIDKGYAYAAENGDVYYHVNKFKDYGKLAHKDIDELQVGTRVAITDVKENPLDFVLWKSAKPGEPAWPSPWGLGRPGWHIECSAMSMQLLGETFDIHGGGNDLKFPHHENEIAQSEAATDKTFANYWLHAGMVIINKQKMSKSLGNFFTIRDVLEEYKPEIIRYFLISSHYRSPVNYSQESLQIASQALERFYTTLRGLTLSSAPADENEYKTRFVAAMEDDFNTPEALAVLFDITHEINRIRETDVDKANTLGSQLKQLANVLGILYEDPTTYLTSQVKHDAQQITQIEQLIAARNQARADKNWTLADKLRNELAGLKVIIEDTPQGTIWRWE